VITYAKPMVLEWEDTLNRIKRYGQMGDTYDIVINRTLDELDEFRRKVRK
jgi:hypothetical protein